MTEKSNMKKHFIARKEELLKNHKKITKWNGQEIGVFYVDGEYYAWRNVCPHAGAPVCEGIVCGTNLPSGVYEYSFGLDGEILRCPWHGWEFHLKTGKHLVDERVRLKKVPIETDESNIYILSKKKLVNE